MTYLFLGTEERGFFAREALRKRGGELSIFGQAPALKPLVPELLKEPLDCLILDAEALTEPAHETAEAVKALRLASNPHLVAFAPGYSLETEILQALKEAGVQDFVTALSLTGQIEELTGALDNKSSAPVLSEPVLAAAPTQAISFPRSVAVAGSLPRIGTTTQAIQLVKYLLLYGVRACYLEMSAAGFVDAVRSYCEISQWDKSLGLVACQGVDLFYRQERIADVLALGYDCTVYDFGVYGGRLFPRVSYLEKEARILVTGAAPNEVDSMRPVFDELQKEKVSYLFSLCPESEKEDVLALMDDLAGQTFFPACTPDAFSYTTQNDAMFSALLGVSESVLQEPKKPRRKGFWKWRS